MMFPSLFTRTNGTDSDIDAASIDVFNTAPVADDAGEVLLHDEAPRNWGAGNDDELDEVSFTPAGDGISN